MIALLFLLCSCLIPDADLEEIKAAAATEPIAHVEQQYIQYLAQHGSSLEAYQGLELVLKEEGETERAYVAKKRQEVLSSKSYIWGLLGGCIAFLGLCFLPQSRWYILTIPMAMAISSLAFSNDLRYKGTVIFASVGVYSMPSDRSTKLFSLLKGSDVRIIEQRVGFLLIEWNAKQGWIKNTMVLSWDPKQSFVLIEE